VHPAPARDLVFQTLVGGGLLDYNCGHPGA